MKTLIGALAICLLLGCAAYQSQIKVGGTTFSLPKDAQFTWLKVEIPTTNGMASIVVSNGSFKMNPAVIDAKTAHDVAVIGAVSAAVGDAAGQAAKMAVKP
jgi:hypothetical protein